VVTTSLPDFDELEPLVWVDRSIFISEDRGEQEVCDLILSFALIFNDLKDVSWAYINMHKVAPTAQVRISAEGGQFVGMKYHVVRRAYGVANELLALIRDNIRVCEHPLFQKSLATLPKAMIEQWIELVSIAQEKSVDGDPTVSSTFAAIRNSLASHYEMRALGRGYRSFFDQKDIGKERAFASLGDSLKRSRFYFADAAAAEMLRLRAPGDMPDKLRETVELIGAILYSITNRFALARKTSWRTYEGDGNTR